MAGSMDLAICQKPNTSIADQWDDWALPGKAGLGWVVGKREISFLTHQASRLFSSSLWKLKTCYIGNQMAKNPSHLSLLFY